MSTRIPTDDEIRLRAYHLWELNGRQDGRELDYWLQAALELEDIASGNHIDTARPAAGTIAANLDDPRNAAMRRKSA
ncbi:MAG: DUF2934 domain-containing protein [Bauldia sp.]|nr:DUF2934 domain-containing protein [Bauldia sp.]